MCGTVQERIRKMKTSASNRRLRLLLTAISKGSLIPQPDFQRRLVWSNKNKIEFLKTVLGGYPFPEIYIAAGDVNPDTGEGVELLVDGQQRITTLNEYFKGADSLSLYGLPAYKDLTDDEKREFLEYEVVVRDLGNIPLDQVKLIFRKINSTSYGLNSMEINNARYDGEFKQLGEELSLNPFFEKYSVFSPTDIKRMKDVTFCLTLIVTAMSTYFERDKDIESFLEKYNESFEEKEQILKQFNDIFRLIEELGVNNVRVYKKNDLFTLIVELYHYVVILGKSLDRARTGENLTLFFNEVDKGVNSTDDEARSYFNAVIQGSNSRTNRILRGKIISRLIAS